MSDDRTLPDVSFNLPAKGCVVCGTLVVYVGLVPLCSDACTSDWMKRDRPPLSGSDRALADRIAEDIEANLVALLANNDRPTNQEIVDAAQEALEKTLNGIITIKGTVSI